MTYQLYAAKGCGSAIVEIVLLRLGQSYSTTWLQWGKFGEGQYGEVNPLLQVPTLKHGEQLLSESLAICQWLNAKHQGRLIPASDSPRLADYARWSVFLVASIYPTFFYGDHPERWLTDPQSQKELRKTTDEARQKMWLQVEAAVAPDGPYFLGAEESILDAYIGIMLRWRPGRDWFQKHAPRLLAIADRMAADPKLDRVFEQFRN